MLKSGVNIHDATHVMTLEGVVERIKTKHGVGSDGRLAAPSKGGFSVTTFSGRHVSMWEAKLYLKEENEEIT